MLYKSVSVLIKLSLNPPKPTLGLIALTGAQHGKIVRDMGKGVRNMGKCSQHDVWMLVTTCSPQARNMFATNSQHRSQHVHYVREGGRGRNMEKMFATWEKVFATWKKCS
jgi:hypothetical protein